MKIFKVLFVVLLNATLFSAVNFAQATLNEFSLSAVGSSSNLPRVILRGTNLDLTGGYDSSEGFRICNPCRKNDNLQLSRHFLGGNATASGYINGTYYTGLHLGFGFSFEHGETAKIPNAVSKIVKFSAPFKVTGSIGVWQNLNEVGQIDRALFYQSGIDTHGRTDVSLRWATTEIGKLYFDKLVTYRFVTQDRN